MTNPNPQLITAPMWRLWTDRPNPAWKLGGIYADKDGYHNTVNRNKQKWPGNYSIRLALDTRFGNLDKSRAIDLTMSDSEMIKWTTRMKNSALDPGDPRLAAVREFYGTLDGKTVYGLIKDDENGPWRRSTSDLTHLWHGHTSYFSKYVNDWAMLSPSISVWAGETLSEWNDNVGLPEKNDSGEEVKLWQNIHNIARKNVTPASPEIEVDGDYGPDTVTAFSDFAKKNGGAKDYVANRMTGWLATKYITAFIKRSAPVFTPPPTPSPVSDEKLKELVDAWLQAHLPGQLKITGDIKGEIQL